MFSINLLPVSRQSSVHMQPVSHVGLVLVLEDAIMSCLVGMDGGRSEVGNGLFSHAY